MKIERGLSPRFRAHMMLYLCLNVVDTIVALATLTYVSPDLTKRFGHDILWRAL